MKNTLALSAVLGFAFLSAIESRAAVGTVATADLSWGGGAHAILSPYLQLTVGYNVPTNSPITTLFGQYTFHTNDVGSVFSIDQSNPGFLPFLARATNGTLDSLTLNFYPSGSLQGKQLPETSFFTSFPYGGNNGIDLGGFQIQRIDLSLNALNFVTPGSNPNGDGNWTDYNWNITLSFIGVVPEPSAAAILGCGMLVMLFRKRSKRSRAR
jgi:hypothetical protein